MEQLTKKEKLQKIINAIEDDYFGDGLTIKRIGDVYEITDIYEITIEGECCRLTANQLLENFDTISEESKNYILNNY